MAVSASKRLLLSSVCRPFGAKHGDSFNVTCDGAHQLMWAQGPFRTFTTTNQWGIDLIAENIEIPTTTLHYPTLAQWRREIKRGYDFIGIAFVHATRHKMIPMVEAVRKYTPQSKIILGGYGAAFPDHELNQYADYICRGEGIEFMRRLLGESAERPIVQPTIVSRSHIMALPLPREGYIFGGLGCPFGCDFCATSHYFDRRHILLLPDGKSIIDSIKRLRKLYPRMTKFYLCDEDFFVNRKRAMQFLEEIRKSDLPPISMMGYGSVKSLSQFSAAELTEMGFDLLWIGFEGKRAEFKKMEGRSFAELFADLRDHGISIIASMIIGFDYQTPEIIEEEFRELMVLKPSVCQFLIYGPAYGTPLYNRLKKEGRFLPTIDIPERWDGFWLGFRHPHIDEKEMSRIQMGLYHKEFAIMGPSVFRILENQLKGYVTLRDHASARVRAKAQVYKDRARKALILIPASKRYLHHEINAWLDDLRKRIISETGDMTAREHLLSKLVPLLIKSADIKLRFNMGMQPRFTRRSYRM